MVSPIPTPLITSPRNVPMTLFQDDDDDLDEIEMYSGTHPSSLIDHVPLAWKYIVMDIEGTVNWLTGFHGNCYTFAYDSDRDCLYLQWIDGNEAFAEIMVEIHEEMSYEHALATKFTCQFRRNDDATLGFRLNIEFA